MVLNKRLKRNKHSITYRAKETKNSNVLLPGLKFVTFHVEILDLLVLFSFKALDHTTCLNHGSIQFEILTIALHYIEFTNNENIAL